MSVSPLIRRLKRGARGRIVLSSCASPTSTGHDEDDDGLKLNSFGVCVCVLCEIFHQNCYLLTGCLAVSATRFGIVGFGSLSVLGRPISLSIHRTYRYRDAC